MGACERERTKMMVRIGGWAHADSVHGEESKGRTGAEQRVGVIVMSRRANNKTAGIVFSWGGKTLNGSERTPRP